ncbi:hypothetical protein [uncultured Aquimarina sp.]|uniref:hypothetical protein n=1 Tax=uncultured Aquimarina sp. TaxID=575652 RepID=UPI00260FB75E|nr:hypothetical protein [uncultured Aquimarina sp.]
MRKIVFLTLSFLLISLHCISQTETSNNEKINLQSPSSVSLFQSNSSNGVWATGTITADRFGIFEDATSTKERLTILPGGNVGIGTINPNQKLQVQFTGEGGISAKAISNGTYGAANILVDPASGFPGRFLFRENGQNKGWIDHSGGKINIRNSSNTPFFSVLMNNGNVGIGTTDPNFALDVSGTSKGIKLGNATENLLFRNNIGGANEIRSYGLALEIETRDTQDISFNSNNGNSKLMIIKGNGSGIGIGTTNPTQKLQVDAKDSAIQIQLNRTGSNIGKVDFGVDNNGLHYWVGGYDGFGKEEFLIGTNGNIGVGTTNPSGKLEILKNADLSNAITLPNSGLIIRADNDGSDASLRFGVDNTNLKAVIQTQQTTTAAKFDLLMNPFGGNVGIGTTDTQGYKLGVNGKIAATEVKVALYNAWPDYVFEDSYNLPSLQEVENHISEKGHLENIPSATEVAENGIQLGEMNKKLLQKIEELTLYMIEQNKVNQQQQKQIKELKNAIEELKK